MLVLTLFANLQLILLIIGFFCSVYQKNIAYCKTLIAAYFLFHDFILPDFP